MDLSEGQSNVFQMRGSKSSNFSPKCLQFSWKKYYPDVIGLKTRHIIFFLSAQKHERTTGLRKSFSLKRQLFYLQQFQVYFRSSDLLLTLDK